MHVLYGVDWRFMLSLAAPAAILGGYGVYGVAKASENQLVRGEPHFRSYGQREYKN